jgi:hypothetical protein
MNNGLYTLPTNPFAGVTISDPDAGATETVTITLSGTSVFGPSPPTDANGFLSLPSSVQGVTLNEIAPGTYTLSAGSPAAITQALNALQFVPIAPSQPGVTITDFDLSVSDGMATTTAENSVLSGAPVITGTVAGQQTKDNQTINPFSTVSVTDSPGVSGLSVTIELRDAASPQYGPGTDANGSLSLPGSVQSDPFSQQGVSLCEIAPGTYILSAGTPAEVTAALNALVFTPTPVQEGQTVTTDFQLMVSDGSITSNDYTTTVVATDPPNCFCQATLILAERGEVPVEDLSVGDKVVTISGEVSPINWIGRRKVSARFSDPLRAWPIRIKANALADNVPSRDLLLSPDHAIFIDGILVHAGALVNGTSIVRELPVPDVFVYYHIELDDHALILADNVPSETFVDNGDRLGFDNWKEYEARYPEGKPIVEMPYPRAKAYRQVPGSIRERLAARAGIIFGATHKAA